MIGKEWAEGVKAQVLMSRMEGGRGFPRRLWQLTEGWQLVCDCILWHVPSKIKNRLEFRVSVRVHSVLGCTGTCGNMPRKKLKKRQNSYNDVAIMNSSWHLHPPTYVLLWENFPFLMMMSSECALVIWLDVIIEGQKGSGWVICYSENQYQTSIAHWFYSTFGTQIVMPMFYFNVCRKTST